MTPIDQDNKLLKEVIEVISREGSEGMAEAFALLLNEAMKRERSEALGAKPYERTEERQGYANGYKPKTLDTRMGKVTVSIPQARGIEFYPQSLERGTRSEKALKLAIAEMYVQGVSTRRVKEITEQLCGLEVSSSQVSRISALLDEELEKFRSRLLGAYPYVMLDARYEKMRHDGQVVDVAVLIATGVNLNGRREVLGVSVKLSEAEPHWRSFLESLKVRGLHGIQLIISDDHSGLRAARRAVFPAVPWQRCQFHFAQNAQSYAPKRNMREDIAIAVRSIFDCNTLDVATEQAQQVVKDFQKSAPKFAHWLEHNVEDCFSIYQIKNSWDQKRMRTTNSLELVNREIKRRTHVARIFPNENSLLRLVTAILVEIHDEWIDAPMAYISIQSQQELQNSKTKIYRKNVA